MSPDSPVGAKDAPHFDFHHCGLSVPSLDQAIAWYSDMLGFRLERRFVIPKAHAEAVVLVAGSVRIELLHVADAAPLPPERRTPHLDIKTHGVKHVAFAIEDLESFLATMTAKQADIVFVVRESFGRGCFIRDCAGNVIEFVEQKPRDGGVHC
jgi:catechol 2,3-dioxygenase-like lactoylglutathione lyase family enzyme